MANDYYTNVIERIEQEINNGKYDNAYQMLCEELNMPYVPKEPLTKFKELEKEVYSKMNKEKELPLLPKQRVLECLYKDNESIDLALDTLSKGNIRNYVEVIEEYLMDVNANRIVVSLIIEICQKQQLNKVLSFYDQGSLKEINPANISLPLDSQKVYDIWDRIGELFENDNPSFTQICHQVLAQLAYLKYPFEIQEKVEDVVNQIVKYCFKAFGDEQGWKSYCVKQKIDEKSVIDIKGI